MDVTLQEAASSLGAAPVVFWQVTISRLLPGIASAASLGIALPSVAHSSPFVLADRGMILPNANYSEAMRFMNIGLAVSAVDSLAAGEPGDRASRTKVRKKSRFGMNALLLLHPDRRRRCRLAAASGGLRVRLGCQRPIRLGRFVGSQQ
jgi:hypothetical protein